MVVKEYVFAVALAQRAEEVRNHHRIAPINTTFLDRPHGHPRRNIVAQFDTNVLRRSAAIPDKTAARLRTCIPEGRPRSPKLRPRPRSALERMPNFSDPSSTLSFVETHCSSATKAADVPAFDPRMSLASCALDHCLEANGKPTSSQRQRRTPHSEGEPSEVRNAAPTTSEIRRRLGDSIASRHTNGVCSEDDPRVGPGMLKLLEAAIGHPFNDVVVPTGLLALFDCMDEDLAAHEARRKQRRGKRGDNGDNISKAPSPTKSAARQRPASAGLVRQGADQKPTAIRARPTSATLHREMPNGDGAASVGNTTRVRPQSAQARLAGSRSALTIPTADASAWADVAAFDAIRPQVTLARATLVGSKGGEFRTGGGFQMRPGPLRRDLQQSLGALV